MYIWKREYAPFRIGGQIRRAIKTKVEGYPIIDLGRRFKGIHIRGCGVYELVSGGLVVETVEGVMQDIDDCADIEFMREQIQIARKERDDIAIEVSNKVFFEKHEN